MRLRDRCEGVSMNLLPATQVLDMCEQTKNRSNVMRTLRIQKRGRGRWMFTLNFMVASLLVSGYAAQAQSDKTADHKKHLPKSAAKDMTMSDQLAELRAMMARLQARLDQGHQTKSTHSSSDVGGMNRKSSSAMQGMGKMSGMGSMSGMKMKNMMSPKNGMGSMKQMGMDGMKKMGMMGKMKMGSMATTPSALPGFPGASHLYHIGATGFFLDHPDHITLTTDQQIVLNKAKEKSILEQAAIERDIEQAEQELWVLTSTDQPDAQKIEAKVRAIEKLKGDQRLAFIRTVGEAAKALTSEQQKVLVGLSDRSSTSPAPSTAAPHKH